MHDILKKGNFTVIMQPVFAWSKSKMETPEQCAKYVQS